MKTSLALSKGIIITLLSLALSSCGPAAKVASTETRQYDSVRVEYRERIVHDTVTVEVPKEVERIETRDTISFLENTFAKSKAEVSGGILKHSLETKPQKFSVPVSVPVTDTLYVEKSSTQEKETVTVEVEKKLTKWQSFKMNVGGWAIGIIFLALLLLILYAAYRIWPKPLSGVGAAFTILKRLINK